MLRSPTALSVLLALSIAACDDPVDPGSDAGIDGAIALDSGADAGPTERDAGAPDAPAVDARIDAPIDAAIDSGRPDGGPRDAGAPLCRDEDCADGERCDASGACVAATGAAITRRYVVSFLSVPEPIGDTAVGVDLDGRDDDGTGTTCVELTPDFTSADDASATGVDNALATLVPTLGSLHADSCPDGTPTAECFDLVIADAIRSGRALVVIEVSGIHDYADDLVEVRTHAVRLAGCAIPDAGMADAGPPGCPPVLAGGRIAPGQSFDVLASSATGTGAIVGGRLDARLPELFVPLPIFAARPAHLLDGRLVGAIDATTIASASLGGALVVEELAVAAEEIEAGLGDTVRSVLGGIADLDPDPADPSICFHLSAGMRGEAVEAL